MLKKPRMPEMAAGLFVMECGVLKSVFPYCTRAADISQM